LELVEAVTLERVGRRAEAEAAYAAFRRARPSSSRLPTPDEISPLPEELRIPDSPLQKRFALHFRDSTELRPIRQDLFYFLAAIRGLAGMIYGEARGETVGGKRPVVWRARDRAARGNTTRLGGRNSVLCPSVPARADNAAANLLVRYREVLCQVSAKGVWSFDGMRRNCPKWCQDTNTQCPVDAQSLQVAQDVFEGFAPDPVSRRCPSGKILPNSDCRGKV